MVGCGIPTDLHTPAISCSAPIQDATGDSVSYCALGLGTRYLGKHSMVSIGSLI